MAKHQSIGVNKSQQPRKTPMPQVKGRVKRGFNQKQNAVNMKRLNRGQRGR